MAYGSVNVGPEQAPDVTSIERGGTGASTAKEALANLGAVQVMTGSYVGTGVYGAENPCKVTLPFEPSLIMLTGTSKVKSDSSIDYGRNYFAGFTVDFRCLPEDEYQKNLGFWSTTDFYQGSYAKKEIKEGEYTVYWYNTEGASYQCNESGRTYYLIAFGKKE